MKYLSLIIGLLAASFQSNAQDLLAQAKSGDRWGYINTKGEFVIDPQYEFCHPFNEDGLAVIYEKYQGFHFIRTNGSVLKTDVEKFKLVSALGFGTEGFSEGMAAIRDGKKWGYMNTLGKTVVEAKYDKAIKFSSGYGVTKLKRSFFIIDKEGRAIKIDIDRLEDVNKFSNGLAPFKVNGRWGFIDATGSIVCEPRFKGVGYIGETGLAWAMNEEGKRGFIDRSGNTKAEFQYSVAKDFSDGIARAKKGDTWIYILGNGKEMIPVAADSYAKFSGGLAYAKKDDKVGFIGTDGEWAIEPQFEKVRDFKNGYAAVKSGDKWGFIDTKGNWVIEAKFDGVKDFENTK